MHEGSKLQQKLPSLSASLIDIHIALYGASTLDIPYLAWYHWYRCKPSTSGPLEISDAGCTNSTFGQSSLSLHLSLRMLHITRILAMPTGIAGIGTCNISVRGISSVHLSCC